jgi:hypothetical protein
LVAACPKIINGFFIRFLLGICVGTVMPVGKNGDGPGGFQAGASCFGMIGA